MSLLDIPLSAEESRRQTDELLASIEVIEARLAGGFLDVASSTGIAASRTIQAVEQGFGSLADVIIQQSNQQSQDAFGVMDDIIAQSEINAANLAAQFSIAVGEFTASNEKAFERIAGRFEAATSDFNTTARNESNIVLDAFDLLANNAKDAIFGIPDALLMGLNPVFTEIIDGLADQTTQLGGGFGFLGGVTSIGMSLLTDQMGRIFAIDPSDFQSAIENMIPAMMDVAKTVGDRIIEEN